MKRAAAFILALSIAACSGAQRQSSAPSPQPSPLIESRGVVMPLPQARANIAFTPWIPRGHLLEVAVIPPLGGTDNHATHGIAMEYENSGARLLLSQWPRSGYRIAVGDLDAVHRPCGPLALAGSASGSLLWTTRNGLVMTLQPDGAAAGPRLAGEARRLLAASGCSSATTVRRSSRSR